MPTTTRWILAAALLCAGQPARAEIGKSDVPLYTDDDLRRVSPLRDQTGGGMEPPAAVPPAERAGRAKDGADKGADKEEYWRREADRLRARLEPLRERAALVRSQIEDRRRAPGVRPYSDARVESLQRRLADLEARIHEAEDRLHERARRAGAWPSWLR